MPRPELSLVIPVFNEEPELSQTDARLKELLQRLGVEAEVIFVDDGSKDRSMDTLLRFTGQDSRFRAIGFSRRFGRDRAIAAGLDKARGRAVIVTDAELQPPEVFLETLDKWRGGFDVVFGKRRSKAGDGFGAGIVESLFGALMPVEVPLADGDFRLLSRRVVNALKSIRETHQSPRALIAWAGFRQATVEFDRLSAEKEPPGFGELLGRAVEGIGAFSTRPLRLATWLGALLGVCSIVFAIVAFAVGLGVGAAVVPLLFSVQFLLLGILGEYVGRIYEQVKRRPLYVVSQRFGFGSRRRAQKLATRDIEEVPSFPRTPSVPPALPQRTSKPPSVARTPSAPPVTARQGSSEVPPPPAAVVAAAAVTEAAISAPRQRVASIAPERPERPSVTPAAPVVTDSAKPPPLKLSSSMGVIPVAPPAPVIPERASTPPVAPRRPSFASIPHPAVAGPTTTTPSAPPVLGQARVSRPPSLPRTPSAPPVSVPRTPSAPPVSVSRTPSAPPAVPRPHSSPPSVNRTPSAPPVRPSASRVPAAPKVPELAPMTARSPSNAPAPVPDDKKA